MRRALPYLLIALLAAMLAGPAAALSRGQEVNLGKQVAQEMRPAGLIETPCLTRIGQSMLPFLSRKDLPWRFWVVRDATDMNAFAAPGGFVFITRPYYRLLNDDQLAFVIGHEMTHVEKRHYEKELRRSQQAQIGGFLLDTLLGSMGASSGWRTLANVGGTAYFTRYSQKMEEEADEHGFQLASEAGYDARGAVEALAKLRDQDEPPKFLNEIFSTHPLLRDREKRLRLLGEQTTPPVTRPVCKQPEPPPGKPPGPPLRIGVRIEDASGALWASRWRGNLRQLVVTRLQKEGFVFRGPVVTDRPELPPLDKLTTGKPAMDYLLIVRVGRFDSKTQGLATESGQPVSTSVVLEPEVELIPSGERLWPQGKLEFERHEAGSDFFPLDPKKLWTDNALTRTATSAIDDLVTSLAGPLRAHYQPPAKP